MTARVVLITGASSGIGYAAALACARAGMQVVAVARRADRLAQLEAAVAALPDPHGDILTVSADVRDPAALEAAVRAAIARFGRLDVLVANAGIGQRGAVADADWDDLETVLRTNIDGVLHSVRAAVPALRQTGGHIIIVSSVVFNLVSPYTAAYAASKAAVSSLARSLRLELADDQIAVTELLVGRTESEFNQRRLGAGQRSDSRLPTMPAEQVAAAIVRTAHSSRGRTMTLRLLDRLIVWANIMVPALMGRLAKRQYR